MEDVDGSGFSLTIPAFMIDKTTSDKLIDNLTKYDSIKLKADLEIAKADSKVVEVGLWYGSSLDLDPFFLEDIYNYQHVLYNNIKLTPHIMSMQCPVCVHEVKERECFSDGLYCLIPPKDQINDLYNITDAGILWENLYGRCVHEQVKHKEPDLLSFFNYLYNT